MMYKRYERYKDSGIEWIGEIPEHWEENKLKYMAYVKSSNVDKKVEEDEQEVSLCNYVDVYYNDFVDSNIEFMKATARSEEIDKFELQAGDVIITKDSETWDDIAVPAYVPYKLDKVLCGYHLALVRSFNSKSLGRYIFRAFSSNGIRDQFMVSANGITRFGLSISSLKTAVFPCPPLYEQKTIANYLDHKTSEIDSLIADKEKLIEKLEEYKQSIITEAVTKGLDPNVKMKDSGIEWIGEIPEHWRAIQIKHLTRVKRGASPRPIDDPVYFDDDGRFSWVRISDCTRSGDYLTETTQKLSDLGADLSVKLKPDSLFISICATVGKPCITKIECCIHDGFVYFPDHKGDYKFLFFIFKSGEPYKGLGKLGTQLNLNTDTIGSIYIPYPPVEEQLTIRRFLEYKIDNINLLKHDINCQIQNLKSYRQSLIYEAVTGKIDVRDFQPERSEQLA